MAVTTLGGIGISKNIGLVFSFYFVVLKLSASSIH